MSRALCGTCYVITIISCHASYYDQLLFTSSFYCDSMASQSPVGSKTNSSFQNYTISNASRKRKRGICVILQDSSNIQLETETRGAMEKAKSSINKMFTTTDFAPRGNATLGNDVRYNKLSAADEVPKEKTDTLYSIYKNSRDAFDMGAEMLLSYMQQNASYEVQKATAISVMATAMTTFGRDITTAARIASDYTVYIIIIFLGLTMCQTNICIDRTCSDVIEIHEKSMYTKTRCLIII